MKFNLPYLKRDTSLGSEQASLNKSEHKYLESGQVLKNRRKELGLSRSELATKTRISISVIEAIENGWLQKLPEKAYLTSMLSLLEDQLNLDRGTLKGSLQDQESNETSNKPITFTPENIDVFSTWRSCILYCLLMLSSLFIFNYNNKRFLLSNSQTVKPVTIKTQNLLPSDNQELKTIEKTSYKFKGNNLDNFFLIQKLNRLISNSKPGWLTIDLIKSRKIRIKAKDGFEANLEATRGRIKIKLLPPVNVQITPPLGENDLITWRGERGLKDENNNGVYRFENSPHKFSSRNLEDLPQKDPLSP